MSGAPAAVRYDPGHGAASLSQVPHVIPEPSPKKGEERGGGGRGGSRAGGRLGSALPSEAPEAVSQPPGSNTNPRRTHRCANS